jgi:UDP-GlcNAc:undecaprenyl-phosphate/decaprenyl-phosphate GlcNAc-1-phosphate transferase
MIWSEVIGWAELKSILGILFIIFMVGLCDDLVHIKPVVKIIGQVVAGSLVFFLLDIRITSTYGIFGNVQFPYLVSYALTVFVIVIVNNSYNLIDGIDGLAGAFATVCLIFFGVWFHLVDNISYSILSFALLGAVIAFLFFNWEPSRIFMGDTGALLLGLALSMLTIHFMNVNEALPQNDQYKFGGSVSTAIAVLILPLIDTTRIIIIRISKGVSPLKADKRHIHHYLVRLGLSHQRATLILAGIHLIFVAIVLLFSRYGDSFLLPTIIILAIMLGLLLDGYLLRKVGSRES